MGENKDAKVGYNSHDGELELGSHGYLLRNLRETVVSGLGHE